MQEVCNNKLEIKGSKKDILEFLYDFENQSTCSFRMSEIYNCPKNLLKYEEWTINNWGTKGEAFNTDTMNKVISSIVKEGDYYVACINYQTKEIPNELFCKKVSRKYTSLTFTLYYYEPNALFAGKTSYCKGLELSQVTEFYENDVLNNDNDIIDFYEFAFNNKFITADELIQKISNLSGYVRKHFYAKINMEEENNIVLDFNTLKAEYLAEKGDE